MKKSVLRFKVDRAYVDRINIDRPNVDSVILSVISRLMKYVDLKIFGYKLTF